MSKRVESIEYLRFLSCVSIVMCHIPHYNGKISYYFGVSVFCIISGFMTAKSYIYDKKYLLKKFITLAPLYYFFTLLVYLLATVKPEYFHSIKELNFLNLIQSFLFIPFVKNGAMGKVFAVYPTGWYMQLQMWFYIVYFVSSIPSRKNNRIFFILISILSIFAARLFFNNNEIVKQYLPFYSMMVIGVALCIIAEKLKFKTIESKEYLVIPLTFLFVLILLLSSIEIMNKSFSMTLATIVFVCFLKFNFSLKSIMKKLSSITYEVFLSHYFVVMFVERILIKYLNINLNQYLIHFLMVVVSFAVGYLISLLNKRGVMFLKKNITPSV